MESFISSGKLGLPHTKMIKYRSVQIIGLVTSVTSNWERRSYDLRKIISTYLYDLLTIISNFVFVCPFCMVYNTHILTNKTDLTSVFPLMKEMVVYTLMIFPLSISMQFHVSTVYHRNPS